MKCCEHNAIQSQGTLLFAHETRLLFRAIDKLLQRQTEKHYPSADNDQQLANSFAESFTSMIERIRE